MKLPLNPTQLLLLAGAYQELLTSKTHAQWLEAKDVLIYLHAIAMRDRLAPMPGVLKSLKKKKLALKLSDPEAYAMLRLWLLIPISNPQTQLMLNHVIETIDRHFKAPAVTNHDFFTLLNQ